MKTLITILLLPACGALAIETNEIFLPVAPVEFNDKQSEAAAIQEQIQSARSLPESRPADLDPDGYWGQAVSGLQLSIRLSTNTFIAGQPVEATVILRNTTTNSLILWSPSAVSIAFEVTDEHNNKLRPLTRMMTVSGPMRVPLPGHRQFKYKFQLSTLYDLASPGTYAVYAKRPVNTQFGKKIGELSSAKATIRIAPKVPPSDAGHGHQPP